MSAFRRRTKVRALAVILALCFWTLLMVLIAIGGAITDQPTDAVQSVPSVGKS